ncbi:hypothetical protein HS048_21525 [Planomonospora sp. ID91781]|uniref:hypothetical protein n=1 Tax=Planomonospora sp. ID91781 TaxID=2738135 RepID=UPI0018C40FA3|nr:hypothetical protein [Planomonospora sp. ID91781]MBG0823315.1 hypothetical protein [Planomonospora sp. ID91781]
MTDPRSPRDPDPNSEHRGMPRWVKVFGIIAAAVILLAVIVMLISGGDHGPGRHLPSGGGDQIQPSRSAEHSGHQQP